MLVITQGDTVVFNLTATNGAGVGVNLTGAVFTTYIKGSTGTVAYPNSQHTANPNQTANPGKFTLSLSVMDTDELDPSTLKEIITKIVLGGTTVYYHGPQILTVLPKTPNR